jgi:hypothetical protein
VRLLRFPRAICSDTHFPSAMIANFEFRPAYDGQVAKPTAAITMSTFSPFSAPPRPPRR